MEIFQTSHLTERESTQVARLHVSTLDESFINNFGAKYLAKIYQSIARDKDNIVLLVKTKERIIGFAVATKDSGSFVKMVAFNGLKKFPITIIKMIINKPLLIIEAFVWQFFDKKPPPSPELQYIAIEERHRGRGLGKQLISLLSHLLTNFGIDRFIVGTQKDNDRSNNFYLKLGYKPLGVYSAFGKPVNYYLARYLKKKESLSPKN